MSQAGERVLEQGQQVDISTSSPLLTSPFHVLNGKHYPRVCNGETGEDRNHSKGPAQPVPCTPTEHQPTQYQDRRYSKPWRSEIPTAANIKCFRLVDEKPRSVV